MSRPLAAIRLRPTRDHQLFVMGLLMEAGVDVTPVGGGELAMPADQLSMLTAEHRAELAVALRDDLPVIADPQPTQVGGGKPAVTPPVAAPPAGAGNEGGPPPRTGPGSGRDTWAAYAAAQGITFPADAGRDVIISLTEEAQRNGR